MAKSIIDGLFGKSPISPLQQHMTSVHSCIAELKGFMVAIHAQDWDQAEQIRSEIGTKEGEADILVGFEPAEALRWVHFLKPDGVAMVNLDEQEPPVVSLGLFDYPDHPVNKIESFGVEVHPFAAGKIARDLGNFKLVNTVMMGAISSFPPFDAEILKNAILDRFRARKPKLVELNAQAFDAGQASVQ